MVKRKVKLVNISDVEKFNAICSKFDCDMDLSSGKYYVNAKSIMGISVLIWTFLWSLWQTQRMRRLWIMHFRSLSVKKES